jgi:AraC family transcriptional regulator of arabinose operon
VTYSGNDAKKISEEIGFIDGVYCIDTSADVHEFFELVYRMHEKPEMNYINDLRRRGILLEYLALAMETSKAKIQRNPVRKMYSPEVYVQKAISFVDMNYATIRVGDIVRYIGLTRSYFTTIFRKHTGISPQEYLMQCRFRNGVRLLAETDLPIQMIAEQIGYEDPLNFSKAFKKVYQQSPTAYRKQVQEHTNEENQIVRIGDVTENG